MRDLQIDNIEQLRWLFLAVAAFVVLIYGIAMKKRALRVFASSDLFGFLAPAVSWPRQYVKAGLFTLALVAIVLALVGPRWGSYFEEVHAKQLDLIVCLDVSKSMLVEDAGMSRLDRAKDDIIRLSTRLAGGTIGLVTFAGKAQLACPVTDDFEFYRLVLQDVGIHSAPVGGTNLGDAIRTARKAFGPVQQRNRIILLITDGEDHGASAVEEAMNAMEEDIQVFTIGIGDDRQGGLIPVMKDGRRTFLKHAGQQLWSKLNPAKLQAIARAGGGEYQPSGQITATQRTLEWLYETKIAPLQREEDSQRHKQRHYVRFHWFAALALALLMIETLVGEGRPRKAIEQLGEAR